MDLDLPTHTTLLTDLRTQTRAEHTQIEHLLRLTEPMSLTRYAAIVGGFHEFLSRWEPRITAALPMHLQAWSLQRRRGALAAQDLSALGGPGPAPCAEAAEHAVARLPLDSTARALGSLYVIEGSALGGQVITPLLQRHLGLTPTAGASYFHGHGERTGAMWREFRDLITREVGDSEAASQQACDSARRTFSALCEVFDAALEGVPA